MKSFAKQIPTDAKVSIIRENKLGRYSKEWTPFQNSETIEVNIHPGWNVRKKIRFLVWVEIPITFWQQTESKFSPSLHNDVMSS